MFDMFVCGSSNFDQVDEISTPHSSPPKRSRRVCNCKTTNKNAKNPFSTRGLEKFSSVLADLEEMKQEIYQNMGSDQEDSLMVRFGYSNAKDWIPIVVKLRDHEKQDKPNHVGNDDGKDKEAIGQARKLNSKGSIMNVKKNNSMLQTAGNYNWLMVVVLVIILCLIMYGRSFAVVCTSIWWYFLPTFKHGDMKLTRSIKEKQYIRRVTRP